MLDPVLCVPSVSLYTCSARKMEVDTYGSTSVE
jgi:hypothetical protein